MLNNMESSREKKKMDVRTLVTLGLLAAMGIVLVALVEVPIFPAAPHLKYDPADVPILIGAMIFGPVPGLMLTLVISFVQSFMLHGSSGVVGFFMNVVATGAMALVVGFIYKHSRKSIAAMATALIAGVIIRTTVMVMMNLIVTPLYIPNVSVDDVKKMLLPIIIPFNLLKAGINSAAAFVVAGYLERAKLFPKAVKKKA